MYCQREENVQISQQDLDKLIKQIPFFKVTALLLCTLMTSFKVG